MPIVNSLTLPIRKLLELSKHSQVRKENACFLMFQSQWNYLNDEQLLYTPYKFLFNTRPFQNELKFSEDSFNNISIYQ